MECKDIPHTEPYQTSHRSSLKRFLKPSLARDYPGITTRTKMKEFVKAINKLWVMISGHSRLRKNLLSLKLTLAYKLLNNKNVL